MIIKACPGHPLLLGRLGENLAREIVFVDEVAAWLSEYPNAAIGLLNQRPGDTQGYPVARAVVSGGALHWTVTNTDLSAEGNGRCELVATDNGVVVKSAIYDTIILTALDGSGETPEPWEDWREYFIELKDESEGSAEAAAGSATAAGQSATQAGQSAADAGTFSAAAQAAREGAEAAVSQVTNLQASAETLEPGSDATAQYDAQTGVLRLGIPRGETGAAGPQGDPGEDYVLTEADKAEIAGMVNVPVTDVQVNGTSVVENGVANVPTPTDIRLGAMRTWQARGTIAESAGRVYINPATSNQIKAAMESYRPIVPTLQNQSVFYGLAKAAGDTTQSASSNAVGAYTDEAKVAIQKMLGLYEAPWELINEETFTNATEADKIISTDSNGQAFELTDAIVQLIMDDASTSSTFGGSGDIQFVYDVTNNKYKRMFVGGINHSVGGTAMAAMARITTGGNLLYGDFLASAGVSGSTNVKSQQYYTLAGNRQLIEVLEQPIYFYQIVLKSITGPARYVLYGRRRWN